MKHKIKYAYREGRSYHAWEMNGIAGWKVLGASVASMKALVKEMRKYRLMCMRAQKGSKFYWARLPG